LEQGSFWQHFCKEAILEHQMLCTQELIKQDALTQDLKSKEMDLVGILDKLYLKEYLFWKHKPRNWWLKEGDKNSKFFHKVASKGRAIIQFLL
jgi:hypothetical protein